MHVGIVHDYFYFCPMNVFIQIVDCLQPFLTFATNSYRFICQSKAKYNNGGISHCYLCSRGNPLFLFLPCSHHVFPLKPSHSPESLGVEAEVCVSWRLSSNHSIIKLEKVLKAVDGGIIKAKVKRRWKRCTNQNWKWNFSVSQPFIIWFVSMKRYSDKIMAITQSVVVGLGFSRHVGGWYHLPRILLCFPSAKCCQQ